MLDEIYQSAYDCLTIIVQIFIFLNFSFTYNLTQIFKYFHSFQNRLIIFSKHLTHFLNSIFHQYTNNLFSKLFNKPFLNLTPIKIKIFIIIRITRIQKVLIRSFPKHSIQCTIQILIRFLPLPLPIIMFPLQCVLLYLLKLFIHFL